MKKVHVSSSNQEPDASAKKENTQQAINLDINSLLANIAVASKQWFEDILSQSNIASFTNQGPNTRQSKNNINSNSDSLLNYSNPFISTYQNFFNNAQSFLEMQQEFYAKQISLWQDIFAHQDYFKSNELVKSCGLGADKEHILNDKRFSDPEWQSNPFFVYLKNGYMNMSNYLLDSIQHLTLSNEDKCKMMFFIRQYLDAIAPTNFPFTNPEAIKSVVETQGASLLAGIKNMTTDVHKGYIAMTDEAAFSIGNNIACTSGKVVYKNNLIELIQYTPTTTKIRQIPVLIIPPFINKYYILDLQPHNSLVKFLVDSGQSVFLLSWKSADDTTENYRFEDYMLSGSVEAIKVVREISEADKINVAGYCIGGVVLATTYVYLKAKNKNHINSITLLTTMLDHSEPGDIKYFIDHNLVNMQEHKHFGAITPGRVLSNTFSALRANELIWNYWVNNYLLGKTPRPFDILYWNNDTVDLPSALHAFVLKALYLNNALISNELDIHGVLIKLKQIKCPVYIFAAEKDHIVPWQSAYKTIKHIGSTSIKFVLGESGHTAGVINPASENKRGYFLHENLNQDASSWYRSATRHSGSWWKDFIVWLDQMSGSKIKSKKRLGSSKYKPLYDAPGENVLKQGIKLTGDLG